MSETAYRVINAVSGIEDMRYLELGVGTGWTLDRVAARHKLGVDVDARLARGRGVGPVVETATRDFARDVGPFLAADVAFVDADHDYESAVRDYDFAAEVVGPGGLVLLHDMVPPSESYTARHLCSDSYRLWVQLVAVFPANVVTLDEDFGLTVVFHPATVGTLPPERRASWEDFQGLLVKRGRLDLDQMLEVVRERTRR